MPGLGRRAAQVIARIGDQGHARLGRIGHRLSLLQRHQQPSARPRAAVIVIGDERPTAQRHPVDFQKPSQAARIFGRDQVGRGQNVQRPQRDVARRSDRRADKVKPRRQGDMLVIQRWTRLSCRLLSPATDNAAPADAFRENSFGCLPFSTLSARSHCSRWPF